MISSFNFFVLKKKPKKQNASTWSDNAGDCRAYIFWPTPFYVTKNQMLQYGLLLVLSNNSVLLMIRSVLSERQRILRRERAREMRKASDWLKTCLNQYWVIGDWTRIGLITANYYIHSYRPKKEERRHTREKSTCIGTTNEAFEWEKCTHSIRVHSYLSLSFHGRAYFVVFGHTFKHIYT